MNISFATAQNAAKWVFETGNKVIATPVVRNDSLFIGSLDGNFYTIDINTGAEIWHYTTDNEIRTTAALYGNLVCFESGNILYALDMGGNLLWTDTLYKGDLINEHDMWDCFRSSPQLKDNIAYIGSEEGSVIGVNVETGIRVFEAQTVEADATIETTPAIYNNKIYVGDWLGVMSVFDLTTGDLLWSYDTKDDGTYAWVNAIVSQPLIYRDTLYFGGRNCNLYAFDPETGDQFWMYHQPNDMWLFGGPVAADDTLYVGSSFQKVVYAFSPDEPELQWSADVYGLNYGNPVIHDDYILVGTGNTSDVSMGSLTIVNRLTHEIEERFTVGGWVETPHYLDGIIYFGCGDGKVYAVVEQDLLNTLRPNTFLKDDSDIDLGQMMNTGTADTSFYIYNDGEGEDSLTISTSETYSDLNLVSYILAPGDSVEISVTLNLTGLPAGTKNVFIRIQSNKGLLPENIITKRIRFEIQDVQSAVLSTISVPFSISQNYPNPASGNTVFDYTIDRACFVELRIVDLLGNEIIRLINEKKQEGSHTIQIDTSTIKNGSYVYIFLAGDHVISGKMTVVN
jgi:outer membrane protein assembly factor BamB